MSNKPIGQFIVKIAKIKSRRPLTTFIYSEAVFCLKTKEFALVTIGNQKNQDKALGINKFDTIRK